MSELPYMPFWINDYVGDCGHLSDAEHGRYLQILFVLWRAAKQRIPNDDEWLAHKFKRSVDDVQAQLRPLIKEFCKTDGNWIWQERLTRTFLKMSKLHQKQSDRAKSGWNKRKISAGALVTNASKPKLIYSREGEEEKSIWIDYDSEPGKAWALLFKSQGKRPPRDFRGGWRFPTLYPPEVQSA